MFTCETLERRRRLTVNMVGGLSTSLACEPNLGQSDDLVDFLARGSGYSLFLADSGQATLSLRASSDRAAVLRIRPVNANPHADRVELTRAGNLVLHTGDTSVTVAAPVSYQTTDGARVDVESSFVLDLSGNVSFALGAYDSTQPLVIDPVISYASYLGGTGFDVGYGIAVDSAGSAYVTGRTATSNFPTTPGSPAACSALRLLEESRPPAAEPVHFSLPGWRHP